MTSTRSTLRKVVTREEWASVRARLLEKEKAHTAANDALSAERRRMPMVEAGTGYRFEGEAGPATLSDLFEGRRQLIVYHHMLRPADTDPCSGCSMFVDNFGHLAHLHARDTTLALVSRAPIDEIVAFKRRMGWTIPWYSSTDGFGPDFGVGGGFGLNVFLREGARVFHTYFTSGRGVEYLGTNWALLDVTPLGRQETWEDSPAGWPQTPPYEWWRLHDEYGSADAAGPELIRRLWRPDGPHRSRCDRDAV